MRISRRLYHAENGIRPNSKVKPNALQLFPLHRLPYALQMTAIVLCAMVVMCPVRPAQAVEGGSGVYTLGFTGPQGGFIPDPGTYVGYNFYYYRGDATADVSASGRVPIPGTGFELPAQLSGSVKAKADSFAHILTVTHVFKKEVLGGRGISFVGCHEFLK
jgi:hypothetical protein